MGVNQILVTQGRGKSRNGVTTWKFVLLLHTCCQRICHKGTEFSLKATTVINLTPAVTNEIIHFTNLKQCLWKSFNNCWKTPRNSIYEVWNIFKLSVGRYYTKKSSKSVKQNNIFFSWWLKNKITERPRSFQCWSGRGWIIIKNDFNSKSDGGKMSVKDRYNLESGQKNMLITVLEYTCDMLQTA